MDMMNQGKVISIFERNNLHKTVITNVEDMVEGLLKYRRLNYKLATKTTSLHEIYHKVKSKDNCIELGNTMGSLVLKNPCVCTKYTMGKESTDKNGKALVGKANFVFEFDECVEKIIIFGETEKK